MAKNHQLLGNFAKANEYDELQNGRIHIVPIDHSVLFLPGGVVKNTGEPWQAPYSPNHNQLLENMSQTWGDRCHCIVFSGMDNDGAIGNKHIVNAGGLVWCQSKDSATQPSMPDASAKLASYRGTPSELAYKLLNHIVVRGIGINEIQ